MIHCLVGGYGWSTDVMGLFVCVCEILGARVYIIYIVGGIEDCGD